MKESIDIISKKDLFRQFIMKSCENRELNKEEIGFLCDLKMNAYGISTYQKDLRENTKNYPNIYRYCNFDSSDCVQKYSIEVSDKNKDLFIQCLPTELKRFGVGAITKMTQRELRIVIETMSNMHSTQIELASANSTITESQRQERRIDRISDNSRGESNVSDIDNWSIRVLKKVVGESILARIINFSIFVLLLFYFFKHRHVSEELKDIKSVTTKAKSDQLIELTNIKNSHELKVVSLNNEISLLEKDNKMNNEMIAHFKNEVSTKEKENNDNQNRLEKSFKASLELIRNLNTNKDEGVTKLIAENKKLNTQISEQLISITLKDAEIRRLGLIEKNYDDQYNRITTLTKSLERYKKYHSDSKVLREFVDELASYGIFERLWNLDFSEEAHVLEVLRKYNPKIQLMESVK
jgi:hypothetical protein